MSIERLDPSRIGIVGGDEDGIRSFIESDFKIRQGLCPNGCGLMMENSYGQECPKCNFSCNTKAQKDVQ